MPTFVIVPVKNEWELTRSLLRCLVRIDVDDILILDNGSTDETATRVRQWQGYSRGRFASQWPLGDVLHRKDTTGLSIYQAWNLGVERALKTAAGEPCYVLVTNNDIQLPPSAVWELRKALIEAPYAWVSYPDYDAPWSEQRPRALVATRGVLSDGGMFGACFMVAAHRLPWTPFIDDLAYEWWYGDNHLAERIEEAGGVQVRVAGLPVLHVNEGTAGKLDPGELYGMKYRDRQRWLTRYDRRVPSDR